MSDLASFDWEQKEKIMKESSFNKLMDEIGKLYLCDLWKKQDKELFLQEAERLAKDGQISNVLLRAAHRACSTGEGSVDAQYRASRERVKDILTKGDIPGYSGAAADDWVCNRLICDVREAMRRGENSRETLAAKLTKNAIAEYNEERKYVLWEDVSKRSSAE